MLQLTVMVVGWIFAGFTGTYMYSVWKFRGIVYTEKPEWLGQKKAKSSLPYGVQHFSGGPSTSIAIVRIAYSSKVRELSSPFAIAYANRMRFCLPSCLVLFAVIIGLGIAQAP